MTRARTHLMYGPPGTGKTTSLARRTASTVRERGPDALRIVSFSVTAAKEIAAREEVKAVLPDSAIGTLHAQAFRAVREAAEDPPGVALDHRNVTGWNESVGPTWQIRGDSRGASGLDSRDRAGAGLGALNTGDALLEQLDLLRSRQVPGPQWPVPVRGFAKAWTAWKREANMIDYTDMIVRAYQQAKAGQSMPGAPEVLIVDEAQDMTLIEAALTLAWAEHLGPTGALVYALDDDQAIMEWRGGDPTAVLGLDLSGDGDRAETLARSFRVPPAVHAVANEWIQRVSLRYPKVYEPREPNPERDPSERHSHGWAYRVGQTLSDPRLLDAIETDLADPDDPDATVMVLATCGYMLAPLLKGLRQRGIPFHNPHRPSEGAWNPMSATKGMTTAERIYRFLVLDPRELGDAAREWTADDIRAWHPLVSVREACLARGSGKLLDALGEGTVPWEHVQSLFRDDDDGHAALMRAVAGGPDPRDHLEWLASVIQPSKAQATAYPIQVARSQGSAALNETPRVVVGTIHSVKGATADRVYVAPDLSGAGARQWRESTAGRDQIIRLMYVAVTRAYHSLRILAPQTTAAVPTTELLPPALEVRP